MGTAIKHLVPGRVKLSFVIFDVRVQVQLASSVLVCSLTLLLVTVRSCCVFLTLMAERQSARMSKITNDGLTRSGTRYFIAVPYGNSGRQRVKAETRWVWLAQNFSVGLGLKKVTHVKLCYCVGEVKCERFVVEPQDAVVSRGETHILYCVVEDRVGEVQWLRDGFGLGPGDEFEGFPRYRIQRNDQLGKPSSNCNFKSEF